MPEPSLHPTDGYLPSEIDAMRKQEGLPSLDDVIAGNAFRNTLLPRADANTSGFPLWHGWAIMDAFLAGIEYSRNQKPK